MFATKFPYAIYYAIDKNTIIVYAMLDMRTNPKTIAQLLNNK